MQKNVPNGRIVIKQVVAKFFQAIETILRVVGQFQWPGSSCSRDDGLAPIGTNHVSINSTEKKTEVYANIFIYACSYVSPLDLHALVPNTCLRRQR